MSNCSKWVEDTKNLLAKMGTASALNQHSGNKEVLQSFIQIRKNFLQEEIDELEKAFSENDAEGIVDAFVDGIVVGVDTLLLMGVDPDVAWNRVYSANITKTPGINHTRPNPFGLPDLIKPDDFVAPCHEGNLGLFQKAF